MGIVAAWPDKVIGKLSPERVQPGRQRLCARTLNEARSTPPRCIGPASPPQGDTAAARRRKRAHEGSHGRPARFELCPVAPTITPKAARPKCRAAFFLSDHKLRRYPLSLRFDLSAAGNWIRTAASADVQVRTLRAGFEPSAFDEARRSWPRKRGPSHPPIRPAAEPGRGYLGSPW